MTELLKDMMHDRADSLGAPDLDVLAMVREGNRRVHAGAMRSSVPGSLPSWLRPSPYPAC